MKYSDPEWERFWHREAFLYVLQAMMDFLYKKWLKMIWIGLELSEKIAAEKWPRNGQEMVKKWSRNSQELVKKWSRSGQEMDTAKAD